MNRRYRRGFTVMEVMVVVLIVGAIAAMAYAGFGRLKERANLNGLAAELHAVLYGARQTALSTGHQVVVLIFPDHPTAVGTGRIVLYEDGDGDFFDDAGAVNFDGYSIANPVAGPRSEVLDVIDLAAPLAVGPLDGQGPAAALPAPYAKVTINTFCSFCTGTNRRGAVAFDLLGAATFHAANGVSLGLTGGSFSVTSPDTLEVRTFAIAAATGAVQIIRWDPTK